MSLPPPTPAHTLRTHTSALTSVYISIDNERIYAGDAGGTVSVTSTRSMRPLARWKAHQEGVLGVQEWFSRVTNSVKKVLTHGRDNKLHIWILPEETTEKLRDAATQPDGPIPELMCSLDVNALNFCRFSLLSFDGADTSEDDEAYVAVPNLIESSQADVWSLPTLTRLHAAIGKHDAHTTHTKVVDGRGLNALGLIMSLHLFVYQHTSFDSDIALSSQSQLRLLCGYENGSVTMWGFDGVGTGGKEWSGTLKGKEAEKANWSGRTSVEGVGWVGLWSIKLHVESVMAMTVSRDNTLALTVSADHLIGRYDLSTTGDPEDVKKACTTHRTTHPGNGSIAIRDDGRVCAVGGWDGKIRLYSTKTLKPLGTLAFHKQNTQCVAFAHPLLHRTTSHGDATADDDDDDDDETISEKEARTRWLAAGSQDCRVSIWSLISFEKT